MSYPEVTHHIFNNASEALIWMTECTIASLEGLREVKRSSKSEIQRHEKLVRTGLINCKLYVTPELAETVRCWRVVEFLKGERTDTGERKVDSPQT